MGLAVLTRAMLGLASRPDHQGLSGEVRRQPQLKLRWRLLSLALAGVFTLLSIGLAAHLVTGTTKTASVSCTQGVCSNGTVIRQQVIELGRTGPYMDWKLVVVGTLTSLAILGTWGLGAWGLGSGGLRHRSRRKAKWLAILCLATLPFHLWLMRFALTTYRHLVTVDYDMIIVAPNRPFALVCFGLLGLQSLLQLGFVLILVCRSLFGAFSALAESALNNRRHG